MKITEKVLVVNYDKEIINGVRDIPDTALSMTEQELIALGYKKTGDEKGYEIWELMTTDIFGGAGEGEDKEDEGVGEGEDKEDEGAGEGEGEEGGGVGLGVGDLEKVYSDMRQETVDALVETELEIQNILKDIEHNITATKVPPEPMSLKELSELVKLERFIKK